MGVSAMSAGRAAARLRTNRAISLALVALFSFPSGGYLLFADRQPFVCPHHVEPRGGNPAVSAEHDNHQTHGKSHAAAPGSQPRDDRSGLRCCCRHAFDGLITTLILDTPAEAASVPLPEGRQRVTLFADRSISQNDLSPPFQPPRV